MRDFFRRLLAAMHVAEDAPGVDVALPAVPAGLSRRSFLGFLAAGTVGAATLDLDRLLWTPGAKTIFLPPPVEIFDVTTWDAIGGNPLMHVDWLTREALRLLKNNLSMTKRVNRAYAGHLVDGRGHHIGDTVHMRVPQRFVATAKTARVPTQIAQNTRIVHLNDQCTVEADAGELATCRTREDVSRRVAAPAAAGLAAAMKRRRMNVMGKLEIPTFIEQGVVVSDPSAGLSVRGVRFFDVREHRYRVRLDILGGRA